MWACAKLQRPPTPEQLDVLLQASVQPAVLNAAVPQATANTVWAFSEFFTARGFKADISPQLVQQLFGQEQVQAVALAGNSQAVANTLLALARLASGRDRTPLLSLGFAQEAAQQLVDGAKQRRLGSWEAQHVANSLAACGELQLADAEFTQAAFTALDRCLPSCIAPNLAQAAFACEQLQHRDAGLLSRIVQRGQELVQQARPSEAGRTHNMVAKVAAAVAALDAQQLAGELVSLVAASGIKQQPECHAADLQRLQKAHTWLQQLGGRGLADVLTEQQLQPGAGYGGTGGGGRGSKGAGGGRGGRSGGGGRGSGWGGRRPQ